MIKHIVELAAAAATVGGGVYAYKRKKGMPAPPVAPVIPNVKPPAPSGPTTPAAPTILQSLSGSASNIVQQLGAGVTDTLTPEGMDITSGGDIGSGETDSNTTGTSSGDIDDTTVDADSALLDALA